MLRPSLRRTPKLEILEVRQVLSTVAGPTGTQQYALELINLVRTNPSAAANMLTANITPNVQATLDHFGLTINGLKAELNSASAQPPVAWNAALAQTAQAQSQYQADHGIQTHQGSGEANLNDRTAAAGYTDVKSLGENTYAYANDVDEAMQSFLFDWGVSDSGHYNNLLQPGVAPQDSYRDVGIGVVATTNNGLGPIVLTQDFGSQNNEAPQILGVVYNDPNHVGFYSPDQGQGHVTIKAVNLNSGQQYLSQTTDSGGYQFPVTANGDYKVTATENGHVISSQQLHVGNVNAKADFVHDPANDSTPIVADPVPVVVQAPVAAPVAVPAPSPAPLVIPVSTPVVAAVVAPVENQETAPVVQDTTPVAAFTAPVESTPVTSTSISSTPSWLSSWSRWTASTR